MPATTTVEIIKLTDLKSAGDLLTELTGSALFYVIQGNKSYAIEWSVMQAAVNSVIPSPSSGLVDLGNVNGEVTHTFQTGQLLLVVALNASASGTVKIGTTSGGDDILNQDISSGEIFEVVNSYRFNSETTVHISAINVEIVLYYL